MENSISSYQALAKEPKIIIGSVVALIFVLFAGYWVYSNSTAEDEIDRFLSELFIDDIVSYKEVSRNILTGSITVDGIVLEPGYSDNHLYSTMGKELLGNKEVVINSLVLRDFVYNDESIFIDAELQEIEIDQVFMKYLGLDMLYDLGYESLKPNVRISFDYDFDSESHRMEFSIDNDDIGAANFLVELGNAEDFLENELYQELESQGGALVRSSYVREEVFINFMKSISRVTLNQINFDYQDDGFAHRVVELKKRQSIIAPGDEGEPLLSDKDIKAWVKNGKEIGLSSSEAKSYVEAFADFIDDPQEFRIYSELDKPVKIGKVLKRMDSSKGKALSALNLEVSI